MTQCYTAHLWVTTHWLRTNDLEKAKNGLLRVTGPVTSSVTGQGAGMAAEWETVTRTPHRNSL